MEFNWETRKYNNASWKHFYYYIDGVVAISVTCHKNPVRGQPWIIEVNGWNKPSRKFTWYKRFHKDDILSRIENDAKAGHKETIFSIFNRLFEGKNDF